MNNMHPKLSNTIRRSHSCRLIFTPFHGIPNVRLARSASESHHEKCGSESRRHRNRPGILLHSLETCIYNAVVLDAVENIGGVTWEPGSFSGEYPVPTNKRQV